MALPGPLQVARWLFGALVRRPADALRPFLSESDAADPTVFDEVLTIATGAGSFAVVSFGFVLFALCSTIYAFVYPVLWRLASLGAAVGTRLRR